MSDLGNLHIPMPSTSSSSVLPVHSFKRVHSFLSLSRYQAKLGVYKRRIRLMAPRMPKASCLYRSLSRLLAIASSLVLLVCLIFWWSEKLPSIGKDLFTPQKSADWDVRREDVKNAFLTSWNAYSRYAWGQYMFRFIEMGMLAGPMITFNAMIR